MNWGFATNSDFLIPTSSHPYVVDLRISNYAFYWIKRSKFKISEINRVWGKDSIPLGSLCWNNLQTIVSNE